MHHLLYIISETIVARGRHPLKKFVLLLLLIVVPMLAYAEDSIINRPHWSFEIKGGTFTPELSNWAQYYGKRDMPEYAMSLAYKIRRRVEVGIEVGYLWADGSALAPLHGVSAGSVTYDLYPVNAFILFRGIVSEKQWIVPYVGGGYTKLFYREKVENQSDVKGSADGYHARGGLQFLLDGLDSKAANNLYTDFGIFHTYLFVEAQYIHADVSGTNLGGTGYLGGILFEF